MYLNALFTKWCLQPSDGFKVETHLLLCHRFFNIFIIFNKMVSFVILCFILNIYKTFIWYGNYISIKLFVCLFVFWKQIIGLLLPDRSMPHKKVKSTNYVIFYVTFWVLCYLQVPVSLDSLYFRVILLASVNCEFCT